MAENYTDGLIFTKNLDEKGTPFTPKLVEVAKVSENGKVQCKQNIYKKNGVRIISPDGLRRVNKVEQLLSSTNAYFIYEDRGEVLFSDDLIGQVVAFEYYGTGNPNIGDCRVFTTVDNKGNITETLGDIIREGRDIIESLRILGNGAIIFNKLEEVVANAEVLNSALGIKITVGQQVSERLEADINTGKALDTTLKATINTGNSTNTTLNNTIASANATKTEVVNTINTTKTEAVNTINTTVTNANNSVNATISNANTANTTLNATINKANESSTTLNATITHGEQVLGELNTQVTELETSDNKVFQINPADWVLNASTNRYEKVITHGMGKTSLIFEYQTVKNGKKCSYFMDYEIQDENSIKFITESADTVYVNISARYSTNLRFEESQIEVDKMVDGSNKVVMTRAERDLIQSHSSQLEHNVNETSYISNNLFNNIINVKYPPKVLFEGSILEGLECDGSDQFNKFIRLCKYVKQNSNYTGGATLYFPRGTYYFSKIPMYSYISIKGDGKRNTIFKPLRIEGVDEFFYINEAPVQYSTYEGFTVEGISENSNQICFNIYAQYFGTPSGGCWYCDFNNIEIKNFKIGFKFSLEKNSYDIANQFLNFNNIQILRPNTEESRCILGSGNQFTYNSCDFSGATVDGGGTNIEIYGHCNFIMLTCQNADYGLLTTGGNINIFNPWFENIKYSITDKSTTNVSTTINVYGGTFANAGYDGNGTGYIAKTESITTLINLYSPNIAGNYDKVYVDKWDTQQGIFLYGNKNYGKETSHKTKQFTTLETVRNLFHSKTILINNGGVIKNISESYQNGDIITIQSLGTVTIKTGGNININKDIDLSITDTVTLIKGDIGNKWYVVSIFKHSLY